MDHIAQQLSQLGQTYQRFIDIGWRRDPERKRDLVAARRVLSEQLLRLEKLISNDSEGDIDPLLRREFGKRLAHLRSMIAYHQASWPAVRLDETSEDYRLSAQDVAQTFRDFLLWGDRTFSRH